MRLCAGPPSTQPTPQAFREGRYPFVRKFVHSSTCLRFTSLFLGAAGATPWAEADAHRASVCAHAVNVGSYKGTVHVKSRAAASDMRHTPIGHDAGRCRLCKSSTNATPLPFATTHRCQSGAACATPLAARPAVPTLLTSRACTLGIMSRWWAMDAARDLVQFFSMGVSLCTSLLNL
ncbi:hypothetical protein B0H13DRAFT_2329927 [Mycena leptocephala]|nr:hypothetical protein B0H13DRAFT_2329927 [Mycena leptocephala]